MAKNSACLVCSIEFNAGQNRTALWAAYQNIGSLCDKCVTKAFNEGSNPVTVLQEIYKLIPTVKLIYKDCREKGISSFPFLLETEYPVKILRTTKDPFNDEKIDKPINFKKLYINIGFEPQPHIINEEVVTTNANFFSYKPVQTSFNKGTTVSQISEETLLTHKALLKVRQKLLDLSKRNKLLNFKETARCIRIIDELPNEVYKTLVHDKKNMAVVPLREDDNNLLTPLTVSKSKVAANNYELPNDYCNIADKHKDLCLQTPYTATSLERRCIKIHSHARSAINETGCNFLYLAIGFLEWYDDDESSIPYRAPLILVPVQLERFKLDPKTHCYKFLLSYTEEDIETNLSLAEKLSRDFDLKIPELRDDIAPEEYFNEVDSLTGHYRRWRIVREMVIGMFSFAKILMYKDLDSDNWPNECKIAEREKIREILRIKETEQETDCIIYEEEHNLDEDASASRLPIILDADSSQLSAIVDALRGRDLVIEGPPGTGKSQTIANFIAVALHEGKSVLFIAEKKAALEVVRRRLDHSELGDFCLELHSTKTQKGKLHADIRTRIEKRFPEPSELTHFLNDLIKERDNLRTYINLINKQAGPNGEKIYQIFWIAERWLLEIKDESLFFGVYNALSLKRDAINDRLNALKDFINLYRELPNEALTAWHGLKPTNLLLGDEQELKSLLYDLVLKSEELSSFLSNVKSTHSFPIGPPTISEIMKLSAIKADMMSPLPEGFEQNTITKFINGNAIQIVQELSQAIAEHSRLIGKARDVISGMDFVSLEVVTEVSRLAEKVVSLGYGNLTILDLKFLLDDATSTLRNLREYNELTDSINGHPIEEVVHALNSIPPDQVKKLKERFEKSESLGFGNFTISNLEQISDSAGKVLRAMKELNAIADSVKGIFINEVSSIKDCESLLSILDFLNNAPPGIDMHAHPKHALPYAPELLQTVSGNISVINRKINEHSSSFRISLLPGKNELRHLATDLEISAKKWFSFISPKARNLHKRVQVFMVDQKAAKSLNVSEKLRDIADLFEEAEKIAQDVEYRRIFGSLFKGVETDLVRLDRHIGWSQELRKTVGSRTFTDKILSNLSYCLSLSADLPQKVRYALDQVAEGSKAMASFGIDTAGAIENIIPQIEARYNSFLFAIDDGVPAIIKGHSIERIKSAAQIRLSIDLYQKSIDDGLRKLLLNDKSKELFSTASEQIEYIRGQILAAIERFDSISVNSNMDVSRLRDACEDCLKAASICKTVEKSKRYSDFFEENFSGINTDIAKSNVLVTWVSQLRSEANIPGEIIEWLLKRDTTDRLQALCDCREKTINYLTVYSKATTELQKTGDHDSTILFSEIFWGYAPDQCEIDKIAEKCHDCLQQFDYLFLWSDYCRLRDKTIDLGLSKIIERVERSIISTESALAHCNYGIYSSMSKEIVRAHPELASFSRVNYENIRSRFIELDKKVMKLSRHEIASKISKRPVPSGRGSGPVRDWTNFALIRNELNKRKRHIPLRQLIRRSVQALQAIKPCFMMSPLSVAQYLVPGEIKFDFVIMDEASQIKPEDALGGIARGSRLLIVGDSKQLPPTIFFEHNIESSDDDDDINIAEDTESILDICRTTYKSRRLRWHYRSEHESLIAFSNRHFYDDNLIVFPSPYRADTSLGIRYHYIKDAIYSKGKNITEAQVIVTAIISHFKECPNLSLGIATFNREQSDLIEDVLDKRRKQNSWLDNIIKESEEKEEPFFIKNLENVQGDERDVIFISFTYGPDSETRKVYQRFGPIGGEAGWRRLNVLFTRAKKRLEGFSSMLPTDIIITDTTPLGVRVLREFLDYAYNGRFHDYGQISKEEPQSDFEFSVARVLNNHGYKTAFQVGVAGFFIDIGVLHPDRESDFLIGIECDGAIYHTGKSVRDRDRLRSEILERKGWHIYRIWSADWFKNREKAVERLLTTVKEVLEKEKYKAKSTAEILKDLYKTATPLPITPVEKIAPINDLGKTKTDEYLRERLINFRKTNIEPRFLDQSKGILRDELIEYFVKYKPTTKEDFRKHIPLKLRENTDSNQVQFFDDIFEIIEEFA